MTPMSAEATATPFDPAEWTKKDFTERVRIGTNFYVLKGIGYPFPAYLFHAVRVAIFVAGWIFFCSFTPGLGTLPGFTTWIFEPTAFQKAFLWASLFEAGGFGCMSGPLGLKIWPPFTAGLHFIRPGTTKLPPFPDLPLFGGTTRSWLDVSLYAAFLLSLLRALVQPEVTTAYLIPIVVLLPLCGLTDKTVILCARVEHHFAMIVCFLFAGNWIAACKWVQLAIWFWAGVSKLTVAFGYVVPIMTANNPMMKSERFRRNLFVSYPDDLHPSALARTMAHMGAFLEFGTPLTLAFVTGPGWLQLLGLALALGLHGFIISNMPIAAVFEWNLLSLYAAFFLWYGHPEVSLFAVGSGLLTIYLLVGCLLLPLIGNLFPSKVSFLVSMRYYAGNWAWNAWLFHNGSHEKLYKLKRAAPLLYEQQRRFLPPQQAVQADSGFLAFRTLHLQGRVLGMLLPQATDGNPFQEYLYADGETVAGSVLGWNFGEGHFADERLVAAVQRQCDFDEGELRVICVEAQPILGSTLHWRIVDARRGQMAEGHVELEELMRRKPWDYGEV
jgi:Transmembrane protein of unknown function (DUF3556)